MVTKNQIKFQILIFSYGKNPEEPFDEIQENRIFFIAVNIKPKNIFLYLRYMEQAINIEAEIQIQEESII